MYEIKDVFPASVIDVTPADLSPYASIAVNWNVNRPLQSLRLLSRSLWWQQEMARKRWPMRVLVNGRRFASSVYDIVDEGCEQKHRAAVIKRRLRLYMWLNDLLQRPQ